MIPDDPKLSFEQNIKTCVLDNEQLYLYPASPDDEKILMMPQLRLERVSHSLEQRPKVRALLTEESLLIDRDKVKAEFLRVKRQNRASNIPAPLLTLPHRPNMSRSRKLLQRKITVDHTPLVKLQYNLLQSAGNPLTKHRMEEKFREVNKSIEQAHKAIVVMLDEQHKRQKRTEREIDEMYADENSPKKKKSRTTKPESYRITNRTVSPTPAR